LGRGDVGAERGSPGQLPKTGSQLLVAGDPAAEHQRRGPEFRHRFGYSLQERPDNGILEARQEIGKLRMAGRYPGLGDPFQGGRLEPAEAEVQASVLHPGQGESELISVSPGRQPLDDRASRIAQVEELGDLVEGLARGVVPCPAQQPEAQPLFKEEERRMPAGDKESQSRKRDVRVLQEGGFHVGFKMIDPEERLPVIISKTLGKREPDKEGADEARTLSHGENVDVGGRKRSPLETLPDDVAD